VFTTSHLAEPHNTPRHAHHSAAHHASSPTRKHGNYELHATSHIVAHIVVLSRAARRRARLAQRSGVQIFEDTPVTKILKDANGAVRGVETKKGVINCEAVLLAGGMWTRQIAADAGATAPLWACEHEYVLTESAPAEAAGLPVIRSYDEHIYVKGDAGRVMVSHNASVRQRSAALCD